MAESVVTAVVVNYRSGKHLESCLDRLLSDSDHLAAVIVVDNNSEDGSIEPARRRMESGDPVTLIESTVNLGLAGGVNLALDGIDTPYLAILNPDVAVRPGWLEPLIAVLDGEPSVGVACPVVVMAGTELVNSAGQIIHVSGLGFNRRLGREIGEVMGPGHDVGGLHGAAFVIRTALLKEMGGWDETGFLYHEDVALSWDVQLSGHRILCEPASMVDHDYHLTMYPEKLHLLERNRWALLLSHLRVARLLVLTPVLLITEVAVWLLCLLRGPRFVIAKARSYAWLWREREAVREWRHRVFTRPRYEASRLRRASVFRVPISQLLALGGERGHSTRIPRGGLPT